MNLILSMALLLVSTQAVWGQQPPCMSVTDPTYVVAYTAMNVSIDGRSGTGTSIDYATEYTDRVEAEWALGRLRQTSGYSLGSTSVVYSNIRLLVAYRDGITEGKFSPPKNIDIDSLPDIPKTPKAFKKQKKEKL